MWRSTTCDLLQNPTRVGRVSGVPSKTWFKLTRWTLHPKNLRKLIEILHFYQIFDPKSHYRSRLSLDLEKIQQYLPWSSGHRVISSELWPRSRDLCLDLTNIKQSCWRSEDSDEIHPSIAAFSVSAKTYSTEPIWSPFQLTTDSPICHPNGVGLVLD